MENSFQPSPGRLQIDQDLFTGVLRDALARGEPVCLPVQGRSMQPRLRHGQPVRILPAAGRRLRRGDIALYLRTPRLPVLHRVVRVRFPDGAGLPVYDCLGDDQAGRPEPVPAAAVIGVVELAEWHRLVFLLVEPVRRLGNRVCATLGFRWRHD